MIRLPLLRLCALAGVLIASPAAVKAVEPEIVEFIFESAPFVSAHASTIVETRSGLVAPGSAGPAKAPTMSASGCRGASAASGPHR